MPWLRPCAAVDDRVSEPVTKRPDRRALLHSDVQSQLTLAADGAPQDQLMRLTELQELVIHAARHRLDLEALRRLPLLVTAYRTHETAQVKA